MKIYYFLAIVVVSVGLSFLSFQSPDLRSIDSSPDMFSSARAVVHLENIAVKPHPVGSKEHHRVGEYLKNELVQLGFEINSRENVGVGKAFSEKWNAPTAIANVQNIVGRIQGKNSSGSILLIAHYDSVPGSVGASDNASSVAAVLEMSRAFLQNRNFDNDIIVLFSDAEELGLIGVSQFAEQHPWAANVKLVINFEARGVAGPSMLFETSKNNSGLINTYKEVSTHLLTNSLFYEVYKALDNDTDFTIWKNRNVAGYNFAYIGGLTHYHTRLDDIDHVSPQSVQHHGEVGLSLLSYYANNSLDQLSAEDIIYFNTIGDSVISYSILAAMILSAIILLLLIALLTYSIRCDFISIKNLLFSIVIVAPVLLAAPIIVTVLAVLMPMLNSGYQSMIFGEVYNSLWFFICLLMVALGVFYCVWRKVVIRLGITEMSLAVLLSFAFLLLLTLMVMPGASYIFMWPLLFAVISMWLQCNKKISLWLELIIPVPALVLIVPIIYVLYLSLGLMAIGVPVILLSLLFAIISCRTNDGFKHKGNRPGLLLILCGLLPFFGLVFTDHFTSSHPKPNTLLYFYDADEDKASWISSDTSVDDWTKRFLGDNPGTINIPELLPAPADISPLLSESFLINNAPGTETQIPMPNITVLSDEQDEGKRKLRLHISSQRHAPFLSFHIISGSKVNSAMLNGVALDGDAQLSNRRWAFRYWNVPTDGFALALELQSNDPLEIILIDQSYSLPKINGLDISRPDNYMAKPFIGMIPDATIVRRKVTI